MNVLTIDLEEWFHLLDYDATRTEAEWGKFEVRIYGNTERLLRILEDTGSRATFFVIGWIARTYPDLVRRIAEKYPVGSHTENHQLVWQQSPAQFREDVRASVRRLEDITGRKVDTFRAPGFSIRPSEAWAFETLAEEGITVDSSIFPAPASHGGWPGFPASSPVLVQGNGFTVKEFPVSLKRLAGRSFVFAGGGYFRLCPYPLLRRWTRENPDYHLSYIHPRDLDAGQPMVPGLPLVRRFKSYCGLAGAEKKLRRYLTEFSFTDLRTAVDQVDWASVPTVRIQE
ncbi:MAG: polysaccharide deacetylase family protein [Bacteroidales bacterium]|nr:polysaccharide deacetylase family protein [Bacteroidales bacterium]